MPPYVDTESGELYDGCPICEETIRNAETQIVAMEQERRRDRAARTAAENKLEAAEIGKRDKSAWDEILGAWLLAFPGKSPKAKTIKSARATKVFQRIERGASVEDVKDAIAGAMVYRYVVFGKRVTNGSRTDDGSDLADIVSPDNDRNFDFLAEEGHKLRHPSTSGEPTPE